MNMYTQIQKHIHTCAYITHTYIQSDTGTCTNSNITDTHKQRKNKQKRSGECNKSKTRKKPVGIA